MRDPPSSLRSLSWDCSLQIVFSNWTPSANAIPLIQYPLYTTFMVVLSERFHCARNKDWSVFCPVIDCGSPNIPRHGYLVSLSGTTYGESAVYNCSKGYDLSGSHMSTCRQQGWSALPQCQGRTRILGEGSGVVGGRWGCVWVGVVVVVVERWVKMVWMNG